MGLAKETLTSGNVHLFKSGVRYIWCSKLHFYTSYLKHNFFKSQYIVKSSQDLISKVTFNGFKKLSWLLYFVLMALTDLVSQFPAISFHTSVPILHILWQSYVVLTSLNIQHYSFSLEYYLQFHQASQCLSQLMPLRKLPRNHPPSS